MDKAAFRQPICERYQQLLWQRCCVIQREKHRYPEPEYELIRALRSQIIDLTQTLFPDIDIDNGVVDPRVRLHPLLQQMRGRLLTVLDKRDRVARKLIKRHYQEAYLTPLS